MSEGSRKARRRRQILNAARDVFAEKGYVATTVDDIAARVAVARGTFYLYFQDKLDVFGAVVDDFFQRVAASIESIDLASEKTPREQLEANLVRVFAMARSEPGAVRIALSTAMGVDADLDAKLGVFWAQLRVFMDETLEAGQRIGLVREAPRGPMLSLALGGIKELLLDAVSGELGQRDEELALEVMAFLQHGLLGSLA